MITSTRWVTLTLYNRLSELNNEEELLKFQTDLEDRFGPLLPKPKIYSTVSAQN